MVRRSLDVNSKSRVPNSLRLPSPPSCGQNMTSAVATYGIPLVFLYYLLRSRWPALAHPIRIALLTMTTIVVLSVVLNSQKSTRNNPPGSGTVKESTTTTLVPGP